jgi:uncharacterized protein (TIGR00730 family)
VHSKKDASAALKDAKASGLAGDIDTAKRDMDMSRYYEDARTLAKRLTKWSKGLEKGRRRFVVCTGGGPGLMEAANRGASEAKGLNIGLNIFLPHEQNNNPYISSELNFEFNYFFMRKFWFTYMAKALVVFPGGFGTMDEFFELMTLLQTGKLGKNYRLCSSGHPSGTRSLTSMPWPATASSRRKTLTSSNALTASMKLLNALQANSTKPPSTNPAVVCRGGHFARN